MIPAPSPLTQEDNLTAEREVDFKIGDPRFVMKALADLYSDKTLAVIREYSTNAMDANIMAGNKSPIRVTLPSELSPQFVVEDDGVGISPQQFDEVYTQFGVSDKREHKDSNGMLGFGSKCGLAYTTQFTVTSVKDGMKTVGVIIRRPDWSITLKVMAEQKTNEPNGTKIVVPVHNADEFVFKAEEFYKYWEPGTVLVNGVEPEQAVGEKIVDGIYTKDGTTSYVVMANVPYRVNNITPLFSNAGMTKGFPFVAYVPSGSLEFTPSREDLAYDELTNTTLKAVIKNVAENAVKAAEAEINSSETYPSAHATFLKWHGILGDSTPNTFKGETIPLYVHSKQQRSVRRRYNRPRLFTTFNTGLAYASHVFWITGVNSGVTSQHRTLAHNYLSSTAVGAGYAEVSFISETFEDSGLKWAQGDVKHMTFEDLKALKPATATRRTGGSSRVPGSWDFFDEKNTLHSGEEVPDGAQVCFVTVAGWSGVHLNAMSNFFVKNNPGKKCVILKMPMNRQAKFARENPTVKSLDDVVAGLLQSKASKIEVPKKRVELDFECMLESFLTEFDGTRIDDPSVKEAILLAKNGPASTPSEDEYYSLRAEAKRMGLLNVVNEVWKQEPELEKTKVYDPRGDYLLLRTLRHYNLDRPTLEDAYIYINSVYAERKAKNE